MNPGTNIPGSVTEPHVPQPEMIDRTAFAAMLSIGAGAERQAGIDTGVEIDLDFPFENLEQQIARGVVDHPRQGVVRDRDLERGHVLLDLADRPAYDFARQMDGGTEIKCSEFGSNIIEHM